jgi:COMPASS component SWD3
MPRGRFVAFSPDGGLLASCGSESNSVQLWQIPEETLVCDLKGHVAAVNSAAFSPNGTLLASGSDDKSVRLWTVITSKPM